MYVVSGFGISFHWNPPGLAEPITVGPLEELARPLICGDVLLLGRACLADRSILVATASTLAAFTGRDFTAVADQLLSCWPNSFLTLTTGHLNDVEDGQDAILRLFGDIERESRQRVSLMSEDCTSAGAASEELYCAREKERRRTWCQKLEEEERVRQEAALRKRQQAEQEALKTAERVQREEQQRSELEMVQRPELAGQEAVRMVDQLQPAEKEPSERKLMSQELTGASASLVDAEYDDFLLGAHAQREQTAPCSTDRGRDEHEKRREEIPKLIEQQGEGDGIDREWQGWRRECEESRGVECAAHEDEVGEEQGAHPDGPGRKRPKRGTEVLIHVESDTEAESGFKSPDNAEKEKPPKSQTKPKGLAGAAGNGQNEMDKPVKLHNTVDCTPPSAQVSDVPSRRLTASEKAELREYAATTSAIRRKAEETTREARRAHNVEAEQGEHCAIGFRQQEERRSVREAQHECERKRAARGQLEREDEPDRKYVKLQQGRENRKSEAQGPNTEIEDEHPCFEDRENGRYRNEDQRGEVDIRPGGVREESQPRAGSSAESEQPEINTGFISRLVKEAERHATQLEHERQRRSASPRHEEDMARRTVSIQADSEKQVGREVRGPLAEDSGSGAGQLRLKSRSPSRPRCRSRSPPRGRRASGAARSRWPWLQRPWDDVEEEITPPAARPAVEASRHSHHTHLDGEQLRRLLRRIYVACDGPRLMSGTTTWGGWRKELADVKELRFTHDCISGHFAHGEHGGEPLERLVRALAEGDASPEDFELIAVRLEGTLYSLNNRRLWCLQVSGPRNRKIG